MYILYLYFMMIETKKRLDTYKSDIPTPTLSSNAHPSWIIFIRNWMV